MRCLYKNCKNSNDKCSRIRFFRIPSNRSRRIQWLIAAGREDLLNEDVNRPYRLCGDHFKCEMFNDPNDPQSRLLPTAVPTSCSNNRQEKNEIANLEEKENRAQTQDHVAISEQLDENYEPPVKVRILQHLRILPVTEPVCLPPLKSPVSCQTPSVFGTNSPRKKKLREEVKVLQKANQSLGKQLDTIVSNNESSVEKFKTDYDLFLSTTFSKFVQAQVDIYRRSQHGRRYSSYLQEFSLSMYFLSPKAYMGLSNQFQLPLSRTLRRYIEHIKFTSGINNELFKVLELKITSLNETDKCCVLCFDEMALKSNLFYNVTADFVVGFEDNGYVRTLKPASSATVFILQSLTGSWKQPIAYCFSNTNYSARNAKKLIIDIIAAASNIGIKIVGLVSDMGSNCIELSKLLGISENNCKVNIASDLVYIFDPCHLIKAMRNNLLKCTFQWENYSASWADISNFYENDIKLNSRLAPKLTRAHIYPNLFEKMRVKLASQVVSHTVASAIETYVTLEGLPASALGTSILLSKFDKFFDLFNSQSVSSPKPYRVPFTAEAFQIDLLDEMLQFLDTVKIVNAATNKTVNTRFLKCWKISINALLEMWSICKKQNMKCLFTRKINQDCVENYFGSIRQQQGNAINPTPNQFIQGFRKLFVLNCTHSSKRNCENDINNIITRLKDFNPLRNVIEDNPISDTKKSMILDLPDTDFRNLSIPEQNAFKYICGYLIHKCLGLHSCEVCVRFSQESAIPDDSNLFIRLKNPYENTAFGQLKNPNEQFYYYIAKLENLFFAHIEHFLLNTPGAHLYCLFEKIPSCHPCESFPKTYLIKLYIRLRIFYVIKFGNRDFKTQTRGNRKLNILLNI